MNLGLLALPILGAAAVFALAPRRAARRPAAARYAHRGLHGPGAPENSLSAFRRAAERGLGAELDVHLTRDGRLAVIHDSSLRRTCGAAGCVEELTARQLSAFRLEGSDESIPFLEEVAPLFAGRGPLLVELKAAGGNHAALAEAAVRCLDGFAVTFCMESFDPRCLLWLRRSRPEVIRGQLTQDFLRSGANLSRWHRLALTLLLYDLRTRPDFVSCRFADRELLPVRLFRRLGGHGLCWTLRTAEQLAAAEAEGFLPIFEHIEPEAES